MTAPLTPPECDLRGYEFMPLYGNHLFGSDFNASVSDAGWRAAVTLWWAAWNQVPAASLPNNDAALTRLADLGRDVKSFRRIKVEALHGFVVCDDGRLYHRKLAEWALAAWDRRVKERNRKANWRHSKENKDVPETGTQQGTKTGPQVGQRRDTKRDVPAEGRGEGSDSEARVKGEGTIKPEVATPTGTGVVDKSGNSENSGEKNSKGNGGYRSVPSTWKRNAMQAAAAGAKFGVYQRQGEVLEDFVDRIEHAMKHPQPH